VREAGLQRYSVAELEKKWLAIRKALLDNGKSVVLSTFELANLNSDVKSTFDEYKNVGLHIRKKRQRQEADAISRVVKPLELQPVFTFATDNVDKAGAKKIHQKNSKDREIHCMSTIASESRTPESQLLGNDIALGEIQKDFTFEDNTPTEIDFKRYKEIEEALIGRALVLRVPWMKKEGKYDCTDLITTQILHDYSEAHAKRSKECSVGMILCNQSTETDKIISWLHRYVPGVSVLEPGGESVKKTEPRHTPLQKLTFVVKTF